MANFLRLIEIGKLQMGRNNPAYAATQSATPLDFSARNAAGEQALRTFQFVVKMFPQHADAWLWLGIAETETLHCSKDHPEGQPIASKEKLQEAIQNFRKAYELRPDDLIIVSYYGEALISYGNDFPTARKLWETYLTVADTDLHRVTAHVQTARACLNQAYFGKAEKMPAAEIKQLYTDAERYVKQAAKICPNDEDVKEMQSLLQQYRKSLIGK